MNQHSNPLETLLNICETAMSTGQYSLTKFHVLNAKDELLKLRQKITDTHQELFNCNQDLAESINSHLDYKIVAWAKITEKGQLYDLRLQKNPHVDPKIMVPLYKYK